MNPMPSPPDMLDFYFDFISPFGWIGAERIGAIAARHGRRIDWHPFLLKATVIETMGLPPLLETPLKGHYSLHDAKRSARYHGLSISANARFGFSSVKAERAVLWTRARSPEDVGALVLALYRRHWRDGADISEPDVIVDVAADLGLPRDEVVAALDDPWVKAALHDEVSAAIELGVFGSPTVRVDGEMFWGSDKLDMVDAWLGCGGW